MRPVRYCDKCQKDTERYGQNKCKPCRLAYAKERYRHKRRQIIDYVKTWYRTNVAKKKAYDRERQVRRAAQIRHKAIRRSALQKGYAYPTLEDVRQVLDKSDGTCGVCGDRPERRKSLHVDHCHVTGKVRGMLCWRCNSAEGLMRSNVDLLLRLADYVRRHTP